MQPVDDEAVLHSIHVTSRKKGDNEPNMPAPPGDLCPTTLGHNIGVTSTRQGCDNLANH